MDVNSLINWKKLYIYKIETYIDNKKVGQVN